MDLVIDLNRSADETECADCGEVFLQRRGPALFDGETRRPVCRECGRRHTPNLVDLLQLADAARQYVRTEEYQGTNP